MILVGFGLKVKDDDVLFGLFIEFDVYMWGKLSWGIIDGWLGFKVCDFFEYFYGFVVVK